MAWGKGGGAIKVEVEISKLDAAVEQLEWAIKLFLDHQAYIPAITLAGAAEEILGRAVGDRAAKPALQKTLAPRYETTEQEVATILNLTRNWLKHWDVGNETEKGLLELDKEALQLINRALSNLTVYDSERLPPSFPRLWAWLRENGHVHADSP
jgi:hypothetical protein